MEEKKEVEDSTEAAEAAPKTEKVLDIVEELAKAKKDAWTVTLHEYADRLKAAYEREKAAFDEAEARWNAQYESLVKMYDAERSENGVLRDALDMCRNFPNRLVCKKFSVDQYFWGHLPEMALILHRAGYPACLNRDDYLCELVIGKAPVGAMAFSIATDAMMRLLRFAATGNEEGKLNELQ